MAKILLYTIVLLFTVIWYVTCFVIYFQEMDYCHLVLVLLMLTSQHSEVTSTYSAAQCIHSCINTFGYANILICQLCAHDPPMNVEMCTFSCKAEEELRWPVGVVCKKCFKDQPSLMNNLCEDACSDLNTRSTKRLCINCDHHTAEPLEI